MTTHNTPLKRRGSKHAAPEVRYEQLIQAGIHCFGENGYYQTTMDQVVKQSGLSKGSLYRFFQSKEELLLAIVDALLEQGRQALRQTEAAGDPMLALKQYCLFNLKQFSGSSNLARVWTQLFLHNIAREKLREVYATDRNDMARLLKKAEATGIIVTPSPTKAAHTLLTLLEGSLTIAAVEPEQNAQRRFLSCWEMFCLGLRVKP